MGTGRHSSLTQFDQRWYPVSHGLIIGRDTDICGGLWMADTGRLVVPDPGKAASSEPPIRPGKPGRLSREVDGGVRLATYGSMLSLTTGTGTVLDQDLPIDLPSYRSLE